MSDDFMAHYGVKGMKWGIRKDDRQARRDRRAQKFLDKADVYREQLKTYPTNSELPKKYETALKDAERKKQGKLSSAERKVAIGAVFIATLIAAKILHSKIDSGEAKVLIEDGKAFFSKKSTPKFKENSDLSKWNMSAEELYSKVVTPINPGYGSRGTKNNCRRATFAYEMRRRGYDVKATKTDLGTGQGIIGLYNSLGDSTKKPIKSGREAYGNKAAFESMLMLQKGRQGFTNHSEFDRENAMTRMFSEISKNPNGSRGELGVYWTFGSGHSMAWEVIQGQPVIFDAQTRKRYDPGSKELDSLMKQTGKVVINRLDDLPLDQEFLRRWVQNA